MTEKEKSYQIKFNNTLKEILTLLEVSGNQTLKNKVRKSLYDFSDEVKSIYGDRENEQQKTNSG
jgi:hypothetical protein